MRQPTLTQRIEARIARKKGDVFLRADFDDLGGYDQVGRSLRALVKRGRLVKLGYGLYTRATTSPFDGRPIPVKGVSRLLTEALGRVGIRTYPSKMQRDYNAGRTTQVPTGRVIGVDRRVRRRIGYGGWQARYERA
jgi:hypothetical protein